MTRLLSIYLTWILSFSWLIVYPSPTYAMAVAIKCEYDKGFKWTPRLAKSYAQGYMRWYYPEWKKYEWVALAKLWGKESAWKETADNPKSTAYGIPQLLNLEPGTPAPLQIEQGLAYIKSRYGKPSRAWQHWLNKGWY